jgi:hypothetical protein
MKTLLLLALVLAGCGSDRVVYVYSEMGDDDLSAVAPPADLAVAPDLFAPCTMPAPGVYFDFNSFTYTSVANPNPTANSTSLTVVVRNSGAFERPADNTTVPNFFHCDTPPAVDMVTCLAPCCGGDAAVVPSVYYFAKGWRMFKAGTCTFKDPSSAVIYSVQFTSISGQPQ